MPSKPKQPRKPASVPSGHSSLQPDLVDPSFLLKGFGLMLVAGIIFAYVTLCVLYSKTQWQIVLHPSRQVVSTPATEGMSFEEVHFGVDSSGEPQLDGWWIPANKDSASTGVVRTVLMLHGEKGTMADSLPAAFLLHQQGLNVLLFDYRGYGKSGGRHPAASLMVGDARHALDYLTQTRKLRAASVIVYGHDVGASLAIEICTAACPAMILDDPDGDLLPRALAATRSAIVPVRWLFNENFPLAAPLAISKVPKLLISPEADQPKLDLQKAGDPKMLVTVDVSNKVAYGDSVDRFLDGYTSQLPPEEP